MCGWVGIWPLRKQRLNFFIVYWTFKTLFLEHMAMCRPAEKGWCRQLYIFYVISDTVPLSDIQRQNAQWLCWLVYLDICTLSLFRHSEMLCPTCTLFSAVWWHCPFNRLSEKAKMNLKVEYCIYTVRWYSTHEWNSSWENEISLPSLSEIFLWCEIEK